MDPPSIVADGPSVESAPASSTPTLHVPFDPTSSGVATGTGDEAAAGLAPWPHRLSASFSAMADQIAAASQTLARVPPAALSGDGGGEIAALRGRLEEIERTQARMVAEMEALRGADGGGDEGTLAARLDGLERKLSELSETVRLDRERLPARLQNARATAMKAPLKTPVAGNGRQVAGFPSTRGEFEHITKERYDALLRAYGLPSAGDTAAKREALREFAGIPEDGLTKK